MLGAPAKGYAGAISEPKTQFNKFREAVLELETNDDEVRFNEKLNRVVKAKPKKSDVKSEK